MNSLNFNKFPGSWRAIKSKINLDTSAKWTLVRICNDCGSTADNYNDCKCENCHSNLLDFYHYPIIEQLQHILLVPNLFRKMNEQRLTNMKNLKETKYGEILTNESDSTFTMIINCDGVVTKNRHVALWPITLMVNEIPLPERRYTESIVLAGVLPATKHPSHKLFETILRIIVEQLEQLESGVDFLVNDTGRMCLKFFLIASCTDKPAASLLVNMVAHNASFSCTKCFTPGKMFHTMITDFIFL